MVSLGAGNGCVVILVILALVAAGPGGALGPMEDPGEVPDPAELPTPLDASRQAMDPGGLPEPGGLPGIHTDFAGWLEWTAAAPLDILAEKALAGAPETGAMLLPSPDAYPGHAQADEDAKREAWRAWWIAAEVAALRQPSGPLDPLGVMPAGSDGMGTGMGDQGQGGNETGDGEPAPTGSPLGEPHSLERLWRLQTHGPPRILLPAGDEEETYLVTDRGVLFIPEPGASPDWMLNLEGVAGHAEAVGDDGRKDLVVGMHDIYLNAQTPSIWVIDGTEEKVRFSGLRGDRALLYWALTDVNGDGKDDVLGVDRSGNITAIELDGTEIYREPVPQPDMPEEDIEVPEPLSEILPGTLSLALTRSGVEVFGQATDDDTLDIFTPSWWGAAGLRNVLAVSLVDGQNGKVVWTQPTEPAADAVMRFTMPTITGDLNGDGYDDVNIWDLYVGVLGRTANIYMSGENGIVLAKDDHLGWFFIGDASTAPYIPLAFVDLNGDGTKQVIGMQAWASYDGTDFDVNYDPYLQVRTILPVPGAPTVPTESHWFEQWYWIPAGSLQHSVLNEDGKDRFLLLIPHWVTEEGDPGALVTVDEDGIHSMQLPAAIGHYTVNTQTGQRYAWTLGDDRWTPVTADLEPTRNGTRLITSSTVVLKHDQNDDGTPDLLIPRSMGYFWVSGRTGAIIDQVDRPMTATFLTAAFERDGRILERDLDHYILYDVIAKEPEWMVSRSVGEDASVSGLADFTGDGNLEILFLEYLWVGWESEEEWRVYSADVPGVVWEQETEYGWAVLGDVAEGRDGVEILLFSAIDDEETEARLYAPDNEDGPLLWGYDAGYIERATTDDGFVALVESTIDGDRIVVLDGDEGEGVHAAGLASGEAPNWVRIVESDSGTPYLAYAYTVEQTADADRLNEYVSVIDLDAKERISHFQITEPVQHKQLEEFLGNSYTYVWHDKSRVGPVLGDWNNDGYPDLALQEANWPVVRSLRDGEPIAVGPTQGMFTFTVDLNEDGVNEVALDTGGSLRLYTFDSERAAMDAEDPFARTEPVDPDEGENETVDDFFDGETEKSPGPPVIVLLVVVAGLGVLLARKRRASR